METMCLIISLNFSEAEMTLARRPQTPGTKNVDRKDHVWIEHEDKEYKCCLCGAVTAKPPPYPTRDEWMPEYFEALQQVERERCPRVI